jgi:hypothetical protein
MLRQDGRALSSVPVRELQCKNQYVYICETYTVFASLVTHRVYTHKWEL